MFDRVEICKEFVRRIVSVCELRSVRSLFGEL